MAFAFRPSLAFRPALAILLALAAGGAGCREASDPGREMAALVEVERGLEEGHYGQALRDLRKIPAPSLPDDAARRRAAEAAMKLRDGPSMAAAFLQSEAKGPLPASEPARLLRAEALVRAGNLDGAEAELAEIEKAGLRPDRWKVLRLLVQAARGKREPAMMAASALVQGGCRDADAEVLSAEEVIGTLGGAARRLRGFMQETTDRWKIQRALGRVLLRPPADPRRAADFLAEVVRARPWDWEARLYLVEARRRTGRDGDFNRAIDEARVLRLEDPEDFEATMSLAEALAERGNDEANRAGGTLGMGDVPFAEAITLYEDLTTRAAPDPATAIRVLHGLARCHLECIPADPPEAPRAPKTHYARCMAALQRAEDVNAGGQVYGPDGQRILAETYYLRGKAAKRGHIGTEDNTVAVGWYEKALQINPRHLEANWDLGLLYYDELRDAPYIRKAVDCWEIFLEERSRRGLPDLDPARMGMVAHARGLAAKGLGFPPGKLTPPLEKK